MDKQYWEERIQAYLDNELEPADRLAVETYLEENEDAAADLESFKALKKRLHAFRDSVQIPRQVEQRIMHKFGTKRRWLRPSWVFLASTMAAAVLLALFLPEPPALDFRFEKSQLRGQVICYGCEVADRAELTNGELCANGHFLGLAERDGSLWRFARDQKGVVFQEQMQLAKKFVEIDGWALRSERLIRVDQITPVEGIALTENRTHPAMLGTR